MGEFSLEIKAGEFSDSEIMVMLGENGESTTTNNKQHGDAGRER